MGTHFIQQTFAFFLQKWILPLPISFEQKEVHPTPIHEFTTGDKVRHGKFGDGVIIALNQEEGKVKIAFPDLGIKEFLLEYANLEKLN